MSVLPEIGDRIRITIPCETYGDYAVGFEGIVKDVSVNGVDVDWQTPAYLDGIEIPKDDRCNYIFHREYEIVDRPSKKPTIIVIMEGGIIQDVISNTEVDVMMIDYDTDTIVDEELTRVDQGEGKEEDGYVVFLPVEVTPECVKSRVDKYRETDGREC